MLWQALHELTIATRGRGLYDFTAELEAWVAREKFRAGLVTLHLKHTSASLVIQENADPDVVHDVLQWYGQTVPQRQAGFRHAEGNSDSHIQCTMVGPSQTLIIDRGDIVLGRWQGIYFCEFDGQRTRTIHVQIVGR